jgi:hypothetical protein
VLLSVPYLCTAIRELRHKRIDDSEIMTVNLPDCEDEAVRSALRFTYSGIYCSLVYLLRYGACLRCPPLV